MAQATADVRAPPAWMYVNELRLIAVVSGAAIVVLGLGYLLYFVDGADFMDAVDVFLGTGIFFILFTVLLFLPRVRSRGAMSFSLLVEHALDEAEGAVTGAVEESGHRANVTILKSRFGRPPREVAIEGLPWKFALRAAPYRERKEDGTQWTEIVQVGVENEKDEVARELRDKVLSRLVTSAA